MTPEERQEKNVLIANWLGLLTPTKEETWECLSKRWYGLRRWSLHRRSGAPIENFSSYYWTPPDFYAEEIANALLLEAMPFGNVLRLTKNPDMWECRASEWSGDHRDPGRKTAICEAALKLIEAKR